tara:strand:+ start:1742 stop:2347 length:606 start_codon:yes stop_codon:yes gene_type:complete
MTDEKAPLTNKTARFPNGKLLYNIGHDNNIANNQGITLFFDQKGLPLLNNEIRLADFKVLLCIASKVDRDTNITDIKMQTRMQILEELAKYGTKYTQATFKEARKNLVRQGILASVKRNYIMINPSVMYYMVSKNVTKNDTSGRGRKTSTFSSLANRRNTRIKQFNALVNDANPMGQKLEAHVLFNIYRENHGLTPLKRKK